MSDLFSILGKRILVTGASSGIGREIAIQSAKAGARVVGIGRSLERLQEVKTEMGNGDHAVIVADLTQSSAFDSLKNWGPFDGVIFNAGVVEYLPIKFLSAQKINRIFGLNFESAVLMSSWLLKQKLINKKGSLIFVSSISSMLGVSGTALYASSKAALNTYTKVVAAEVAPQGIRANSICPGIVITPMTEQAKQAASSDLIDDPLKEYPLGYGKPADIAGLVLFLLSDASRWITGNNIVIDGGYTLK